MTTVVNVHRVNGITPAFDVYIGRASARAADPRCRVTSEWCNPLRRLREGGRLESVEHLLRRYERVLREYLANNPDAVPRLLALRGKRLGCWCKPDPCHGDVLVRVIEELWAETPLGRALMGRAESSNRKVQSEQREVR